jgi:hypothetical protein
VSRHDGADFVGLLTLLALNPDSLLHRRLRV